jgi:hypothetical protein
VGNDLPNERSNMEYLVMTASEQSSFDYLYKHVDRAREILEHVMAGAPESDEDLRVACARLDNWLLENSGRWTQ